MAVFSRSLDDLTARVPEIVAAALRVTGRAGRPRRRGPRGGRAGAGPARSRRRRVGPPSCAAGRAHPVLLRRAPPRRHRPARRAGSGALGRSRRGGTRAHAGRSGHGRRRPKRPGRVRHRPGRTARRAWWSRRSSAPYDVGRRGSAWVKVKPRHTLDLVVLAAEWGHGRRKGWLSNLHLGARDPAGGFVMLGKTFKGLTDAMLHWQTERAARPGRRPGRLGGDRAPGAGRGDRLRRGAGQHPVPGRGHAALRPGAALPRGQAGRRGRHPRRRPGPGARSPRRPTCRRRRTTRARSPRGTSPDTSPRRWCCHADQGRGGQRRFLAAAARSASSTRSIVSGCGW